MNERARADRRRRTFRYSCNRAVRRDRALRDLASALRVDVQAHRPVVTHIVDGERSIRSGCSPTVPPLSPPSPGGGQVGVNVSVVPDVVIVPLWRRSRP